MINLLPYKNKKQIRAARHNVILLKCLIYLLLGVVFITSACLVTYQFLKMDNSGKNQTTESVNGNQMTISGQTEEIESDLATAETIFKNRVSYSDIINEITASLPPGAIVDNISLNNNSINDPVNIYFRAKTQDAGQQIKNNLAKSKLFFKPKIISITSMKDGQSDYPNNIMINTEIKKASNI